MPSTLLNPTQTQVRPEVLKTSLLPAMLAAVLGLVLLYAAGFSAIAPLHNAAHDGRHSASFPCH
jgi:cobalt transporter subunit CbtB